MKNFEYLDLNRAAAIKLWAAFINEMDDLCNLTPAKLANLLGISDRTLRNAKAGHSKVKRETYIFIIRVLADQLNYSDAYVCYRLLICDMVGLGMANHEVIFNGVIVSFARNESI